MKVEQFMEKDLVCYKGSMAQLIHKPECDGLYLLPAFWVYDFGAGPGEPIPFTQTEADQCSQLYRSLTVKQ